MSAVDSVQLVHGYFEVLPSSARWLSRQVSENLLSPGTEIDSTSRPASVAAISDVNNLSFDNSAVNFTVNLDKDADETCSQSDSVPNLPDASDFINNS